MSPERHEGAAKRLGVFGGTFDPPHLGHLAVGRVARDHLVLDEVKFVVAGDPWQKRDRHLTPARLRFELTELLVAREERLTVDDREIRRGGPTFTVDTVEELLAEGDDLEVFLIVGADAANGISSWHRATDLANLVTLAIAPRPNAAVIDLGQEWRTCTLPDLENPCASTDLRASALDHAFLTQCLPPSILRRLSDEGLYHGLDGH